MSLNIKEINVQNLGPLSEISLELARFNLIYGRNEKGKTYLVEFVIRSLFRKTRLWPLRSQKGKGKVVVEGLTNGGLIDFHPNSAKKLEDFWEESNVGLPPDFSKLLVVKGAEVEIANVEGGADRVILKRFLSSREILDKIEANISKTIQECQIENNIITGPKRGEINIRLELSEQLKKLNQLFEQVDKGFSGGTRKTLADKKEQLKAQINQQVNAKKYIAYTTDKELKKLKVSKHKIAADKIHKFKSGLNINKQKVAEYKKKKDEQKDAEFKSKHYEWLKSALEVYENILKQEFASPKPVFLILAIAMVVIAGVFAVMKMPIFAIIALAGIIVFGMLHVRQYRIIAERAVENLEIKNLKREFKKHFQRELTGLPIVKELLHRMEEDYNTARLLKKQLTEDLNSLYTLKLKLSELLEDLTGVNHDSKTWDAVLRDLEKEFQKLENQIREKELYLAKLGVDPSDFLTQKTEVPYSNQTLDEFEKSLQLIQQQVDEETQKLTNLKQLICQQTDDNISTSWEIVLRNLQEKREQVIVKFKQKTAEIIGKMAVNQVISELRKAEDGKIIAGLKSKSVLEPLFQITNRYNGLYVDGDKLVVSDPFNTFDLSEISTGGQEQVLLALRIGFSTMMTGKDCLFLVLDDAFQYSDWERRILLTDKVAELAQNGWQIIYFTMDDNIRALFDEKGAQFGEQYKSIELT